MEKKKLVYTSDMKWDKVARMEISHSDYFDIKQHREKDKLFRFIASWINDNMKEDGFGSEDTAFSSVEKELNDSLFNDIRHVIDLRGDWGLVVTSENNNFTAFLTLQHLVGVSDLKLE